MPSDERIVVGGTDVGRASDRALAEVVLEQATAIEDHDWHTDVGEGPSEGVAGATAQPVELSDTPPSTRRSSVACAASTPRR